MAKETAAGRTTRVTKTTSTSLQTTDELRSRIEGVSKELHHIEAEVRKDAESLERVRQLLDVSYLNELMSIIDELEVRITESSQAAQSAESEKDQFRHKFEEEQERLEKLWDAYKAQERELTQLREKVPRLESELRAKDAGVADAEAAIDQKEDEIRRLDQELGESRQKVADLEAAREDLKNLEGMKSQIEELETRYEEEKERLAKLYVVYEELEAERDGLKRQVDERDAWFAQVQPAMETICRSVRRRASMPGSSGPAGGRVESE